MVDGELKIPPTIEVCATGSYISGLYKEAELGRCPLMGIRTKKKDYVY